MKALILAAAIALAAATAQAGDLAWIDSPRGKIYLTNEPVTAGTRTAVLEHKPGVRMLGSWEITGGRVVIQWMNGRDESFDVARVNTFKFELAAP